MFATIVFGELTKLVFRCFVKYNGFSCFVCQRIVDDEQIEVVWKLSLLFVK